MDIRREGELKPGGVKGGTRALVVVIMVFVLKPVALPVRRDSGQAAVRQGPNLAGPMRRPEIS